MNNELTFKVIFATLYILLGFIRGYYLRKVRRLQQSAKKTFLRESWKDAVKLEGKLSMGLQAALFPLYIAAIVLYAIYPHWMVKFTLPLPIWLRWIGVGLGIASLSLWVWAQHILGKHGSYWAPSVELRKEHTLITSGPYRWVRYPMHTAHFALMVALALVSANWLVALFNITAIIIVYLRMGKEETMMIEQLGDEYRAYMKRTGRLLPRFIREKD